MPDATVRLSVEGPRRRAGHCPSCGSEGEATALFAGVFMCLTDGCRVWTFEDLHA